MPLSHRRRGGQSNALDAWPGYVDALSTLLMVIIFVLLVFVLAQAFLGAALSGKDQALDKLGRQVSELTDMLSLERSQDEALQQSAASLSRDLDSALASKADLSSQLASLHQVQAQAQAASDALRTERDQLAAGLAEARKQAGDAASQAGSLQSGLAAANTRADEAARQAAATAAQLADAQAQLATLRAQAATLDQTVSTDRDTIQARLSDLARLTEQTRALSALRDELEQRVREAAAHAATSDQQRDAAAAQLADERKFSDSARAQIALLNKQLDGLRAQMQQVAQALDIATAAGRDKDAQITALGTKLNTALASKVEELQRYRSEFFGRLRDVLAGKPGIQVVGDRFVFQSEVLFPAGSADLSPAGTEQIHALASTLKQIIPEIPRDIAWLLRVDGHADHDPVSRGQFPSNWELSSERAINVVKLLISSGIPAEHLAATGFADFQPLDAGNSPEAYARNRRIELRLTDR